MSRIYLAAGPWMIVSEKMCRRIVLYVRSPDKLVVHQECYDASGDFGYISFGVGNYFSFANLQLAMDRWEQRNLENMQHPHEPGVIKPRLYASIEMAAEASEADATYTSEVAKARA